MNNRYVALLRGINVGGNNKVEMPRLRTVFENLGFENVVTYINSGNVLFDARNPVAKKIEAAIEQEFWFFVPTLIVPQEKLKNIDKATPHDWATNSEQRTNIIFLWDEIADKNILEQIKQNPDADTLIYADGVIIWHYLTTKANQSKTSDFIKNPLYKKCTVRNINTVRKLVDL